MSAGMYGADIEALRRLAETVDDGGSTLDTVVATVDHVMPTSSQWEGPDGASFREEWNDTHAVTLRAMADALRDVAAILRDNADEQESTSNDAGTGPGSGPGAPGPGAPGPGTPGPSDPGGDGDDADSENPLPTVGSDPTKPTTDPNDPDHDPLSGNYRNDSAWAPAPYEYHGVNDLNDDGAGFVSTDEDVATSSKPDEVRVTLLEGETGDFAGYQEGVEGAVGSEDGAHASGEASVSAGAGYDMSGSATISSTGAVLEGSVGVNAGVGASASGQVGYGEHLGAEGSAEAFVGGRAEATGGLSVGPHGLGASAGVDAFVGAEAGVDGSVTAAGVTAGGSANVYAGIGINAGADVNFGMDSVAVDLEFGAALGIGAGFDVSLDWSPADTVDAIGDFGGDFVDGITGGWW
jgi:uncharacterized protein YukE